MMNYSIDGNKYIANDGYVFKLKNEESVFAKVLILGINDSIDNYEVVESIPEENEATETDYVKALEELGVNFDE